MSALHLSQSRISKDNLFHYDQKTYQIKGMLKIVINFLLIVFALIPPTIIIFLGNGLIDNYDFELWFILAFTILLTFIGYKIAQFLIYYLIKYLVRNQSVIEIPIHDDDTIKN